jgi:hypothetical protein
MRPIGALALLLAIGFGTIAQDAFAASRNAPRERAKVLSNCNKQATQRMASSVRRRIFLQRCMRAHGFSGPP